MNVFNEYVKRGLLKKRRANFKQIEKQLIRALKDLSTFKTLVCDDPEWASTVAYQAMLRSGRALIYAYGYLPSDGQQHKTVVEVTGIILGKKFNGIVSQFNKLRKKRNIFFYDSLDTSNIAEAKKAGKTAKQLINAIHKKIIEINPQISLNI
jgi:uncharacterized protein (UPF0332 family)